MHISSITISTGMPLRVFVGHTNSVRACAIDGSGRYLVSGGKDAAVRCHDTATGEVIWLYHCHTDYINTILVIGDMQEFHNGRWRGGKD